MRPEVMGGGVKEDRMGPDGTSENGIAPDAICTAIALEPGVAAPMAKPLMVTVNAKVALMVVPDVVSTTAVPFMDPHVMFRLGTLLAPAATKGVIEDAKKLSGYIRVMESPGGIAVVTVKVRVTGTLDLKAMRLDDSMTNFDSSKAAMDTTGSVDVEMRSPPNVLAIVKIVKPEQVTVIGPLCIKVDVVIIMVPLRMNDDVVALTLPTPQIPVLPMKGK